MSSRFDASSVEQKLTHEEGDKGFGYKKVSERKIREWPRERLTLGDPRYLTAIQILSTILLVTETIVRRHVLPQCGSTLLEVIVSVFTNQTVTVE